MKIELKKPMYENAYQNPNLDGINPQGIGLFGIDAKENVHGFWRGFIMYQILIKSKYSIFCRCTDRLLSTGILDVDSIGKIVNYQ